MPTDESKAVSSMLYCYFCSRYYIEQILDNKAYPVRPLLISIYEQVCKKEYDVFFFDEIFDYKRAFMSPEYSEDQGIPSIAIIHFQDKADIFRENTRIFIHKSVDLDKKSDIFSKLLDEAYEASVKNYLPAKCWQKEGFSDIKLPYYSEHMYSLVKKSAIISSFMFDGHKYLIGVENLLVEDIGGYDKHKHIVKIKYPCSLIFDKNAKKLPRSKNESTWVCFGTLAPVVYGMICDCRLEEVTEFINMFMLQRKR